VEEEDGQRRNKDARGRGGRRDCGTRARSAQETISYGRKPTHSTEVAKLVLVYVLKKPVLRETDLDLTLLSLEPLGRPSKPLSSVPADERFVVMTESSLEKKSSSAS